jgi:hypothetical protein
MQRPWIPWSGLSTDSGEQILEEVGVEMIVMMKKLEVVVVAAREA